MSANSFNPLGSIAWSLNDSVNVLVDGIEHGLFLGNSLYLSLWVLNSSLNSMTDFSFLSDFISPFIRRMLWLTFMICTVCVEIFCDKLTRNWLFNNFIVFRIFSLSSSRHRDFFIDSGVVLSFFRILHFSMVINDMFRFAYRLVNLINGDCVAALIDTLMNLVNIGMMLHIAWHFHLHWNISSGVVNFTCLFIDHMDIISFFHWTLDCDRSWYSYLVFHYDWCSFL